MRINQQWIYLFIPFTLLMSCTPPSNETVFPFSNNENFYLTAYNVEVELIPDNSEFVKMYGFYSNPNQVVSITEDTIPSFLPYPLLMIRTANSTPNEVNKIELHFTDFRRLYCMQYAPINLGVVPIGKTIYTSAPIVTDSVDLFLNTWQDSLIEINSEYLKVSGGDLSRCNLKGSAHHFEVESNYSSQSNPFITTFRFDQLITDSCSLNFTLQYIYPSNYNFQTKIFVHADEFLEVNVGALAGDGYACTGCLCEIYYKGHPTILNHDSLNSQVVIIDNN